MQLEHETTRPALQQKIDQDEQEQIDIDSLQHIQTNPNLFSQFLSLHHVKAACRYWCGVTNKNLFRYNPQFDKVISTTILRDIALQKKQSKQKMQVFKNAIGLQIWSFLLIILICMLAGAASVIPMYYQRTLVQYIISQQNGDQYTYFWIIVGVIVFRYFIFNYLVMLSNTMAINTKIYLQNYYMRAIFFVHSSQADNQIHRFKYLTIQHIVEGIIYFPYLLISIFTVIGIIVLIFILDQYYGFIVFGIFILFFIILIILLIASFFRLRSSEQKKQKRQKMTRLVFLNLISLIFQNLVDVIVKRLITLKKQQLSSNRFINVSYSIAQALGDSVIVISVMIYYGLLSNKQTTMTLQNTYLTAVYLSMMYYPLKIFIYGSFIIVKAVLNYYNMLDDFKVINYRDVQDVNKNITVHNSHGFFQNLGSCFNYDYQEFSLLGLTHKVSVESSEQLPTTTLSRKISAKIHLNDINPKSGECIMLFRSINAPLHNQQYIQQLFKDIGITQTSTIIGDKSYILPDSLLQNILLYSQYNQQKLNKILKLVQLEHLLPQITTKKPNSVNFRIAKYYHWHQMRFQLARALYNEVDYLIINKYMFIQNQQLVKNVIDYRRACRKVTIIINNWREDLFKYSDKVLIFQENKIQIGKYTEMIDNQQSFIHKIKMQSEGQYKQNSIAEFQHISPQSLSRQFHHQKLVLKKIIYWIFFRYAHKGAAIIVILAILIPSCLKFYMNYMVGQSASKVQIYPDYLIFGVIYLVMVLVRGLVLSFYLRTASKNLFESICLKHRQLNANQILTMYKSSDDSIQINFRRIDQDMVMNFQIGFTIMIEGYVSLVIASIGHPVYLAMAFPVMIVLAIINISFYRIFRNIQSLRERYINDLRNFVRFCSTKSKYLLRYGRYQEIQKRFHALNRMSVLFSCNEMWAISGMRMIGQAIIIVGIIIYIIIMIQTQKLQLANVGMITFGVSLFINMNFSYRFNLKTFSVLQAQMVALTKCINVDRRQYLNDQDEEEIKNKLIQKISDINTIKYTNVDVDFGKGHCKNINIQINKGDKIAISYDSKIMARIPFYLLRNNVIDQKFIKGSIEINGTVCQQEFNVEKVYYLHQKPVLPQHRSILETWKIWDETMDQEKGRNTLNDFFTKINLPQIFTIDTIVSKLSLAQRQILQICRVINYQKCQMLIIMGGLDSLDILTRSHIQKYLVNSSGISIIISFTNLPAIKGIYSKQLNFHKGTFGHKESGEQNQSHFQNNGKILSLIV